MDKKIILVTGTSSGLGKQTALALAKQGHTIIMHGRNLAAISAHISFDALAEKKQFCKSCYCCERVLSPGGTAAA